MIQKIFRCIHGRGRFSASAPPRLLNSAPASCTRHCRALTTATETVDLMGRDDSNFQLVVAHRSNWF
jgi:hypothetical protein